MIELRTLGDGAAEAWDEYVRGRPDGTFFHLSGWRTVLERGLGHRAHYLYAVDGGRIRGVLPLGQLRSRLFGHSLVSTPFCVYGGPVADDEETERALTEAARGIAERLGVGHLELRNRVRRCPDWHCGDLYVTFRKPIAADDDENLKAIPRKQRAMVRKGIGRGLVSEVDADDRRLYPIFAESVRNLGTPVFPRRLFRTLLDVFRDSCEIVTILDGGSAVASVLSFQFRDEVLPYYGGGLPAARECAGNDFMYWEVMRRAAERGMRWFDFGRSKREVGSYRFKKHWGFEPAPLPYEYLLVRARELPNVNPLNPRYRLMVETWKRLPPGLARILGPPIARNLG